MVDPPRHENFDNLPTASLVLVRNSSDRILIRTNAVRDVREVDRERDILT